MSDSSHTPPVVVLDVYPEVNRFVETMAMDGLLFYDINRCLEGAVWAWGVPKRIAGVVDDAVDNYRIQCDEMTGGQGETEQRLRQVAACVETLCHGIWEKLSRAGFSHSVSDSLQDGYMPAPYKLHDVNDYYRAMLHRTVV